MGRRRGYRTKVRDFKLGWTEHGPNANRDLQILFRERKLKEMPARDMTFMEQRRFLDLQFLSALNNQ